MSLLDRLKSLPLLKRSDDVAPLSENEGSGSMKWLAGLLVLIFIGFWVLGFYWSREPDLIDPVAAAQSRLNGDTPAVGYTTAATLAHSVETLLNKPGGYLSNDVLPPSVFLDNMPNWEFGVLVQARDLARSLRNDLSRSRSQSVEDPDLIVAEPKFHFDNDSWIFPATEDEYRAGLNALYSYMDRLQDSDGQDGQFFARSDNLIDYLDIVNKRLGSLSQRLSASAGQYRVNTDLISGDNEAASATETSKGVYVKNSWFEIDDVFYEARGATWALTHYLRAMEHDFADVLEKKNARTALRQIILELEATQEAVMSPIILNGSGFGLFANHSLTLSSYIARVNAAVIDLKTMLADG